MTAAGTLGKSGRREEIRTSIITWAATYVSGKPFEGPILVTLREYPPESRALGVQELIISARLQGGMGGEGSGLPAKKWEVANQEISAAAPTVPVLVYIFETPTKDARRLSESARNNIPSSSSGRGEPASRSLFVVTCFENLPTLRGVLDGLTRLPSRPPPSPAVGSGTEPAATTSFASPPLPPPPLLGDDRPSFLERLRRSVVGQMEGNSSMGKPGVNDRDRMVWTGRLVGGMLRAVATLHDLGVAHGAVTSAVMCVGVANPGAVQKDEGALATVRLENLGLAATGAATYTQDRRYLAVVVLEVVLKSMAGVARPAPERAPAPVPGAGTEDVEDTVEMVPESVSLDHAALSQLLFGACGGSVAELRAFVASDEVWEGAVAFLGAGGDVGWRLLTKLVEGDDQRPIKHAPLVLADVAEDLQGMPGVSPLALDNL